MRLFTTKAMVGFFSLTIAANLTTTTLLRTCLLLLKFELPFRCTINMALLDTS